ncbi:LPS biosynthesis-modulating metalloenzyme YejM [Xenorhabdus bovienii]|uniref:LPS biosynthesis-modulating metalloenzyme YejM n=1 Tax=Xenorhabdus bovienii TaxID=40576 RepID=UPI0023B3455B|nr:LPS biosynthesis-modulating metalloenzyme YejM [Xenorhabdus bovienii]MDE9461609.1 LPS biosynthesis-modulating metalloenzyme YejM [Xenorhabdus bovienii]MDE9467911.1 LPS biosynthesis-modulating metalloenzyme YejM [Xenorhabdus bovienii]
MVTSRQHYREKVSQMISWGHWFALFNIMFSLVLGSRYLFASDWPGSLFGRIYALLSWLGHFSFIVFAIYLLILFPLTFIVMSQRLLRFLSAALATAGLTLLILDSSIYIRFHLHLTPLVWDLVTNPEQGELTREWQLMFICIPAIFLVQMLFGTWSWQKLRSLNRQRFGKPLAAVFITAFIASHLMYIWADANFYRSITMQRSNLPLSYPMTARKFLEKHGLLDQQEYQRRMNQQGNPAALTVEYPLNGLSYQDNRQGYNLLLLVVDGLDNKDITSAMPSLERFTQNNIQFTQHFSTGIQNDTALFGLFYGISSGYLDGILNSRKSSALLDALTHQRYQFGLFSSDGFQTPLYRQALLTDYSFPTPTKKDDSLTVTKWRQWLDLNHGTTPWFSFLGINGFTHSTGQFDKKALDTEINNVLETLTNKGMLDKTIVVITAKHSELPTGHSPKWLTGDKFNREQIHVPLIIHWPGTPAQVINKLTSHQDVMTTLMQRLLHVSNSPDDYSQGEDLFTAQRDNPWLITGDDGSLIVTTATNTIYLSKNGEYYLYDLDGNEIQGAKPNLAQLLQILTEVKRFLAN